MTKFTRGPAYVRMRAVTGTLLIAFGVAIAVRTVAGIGLVAASIVPLVMSAALVGAGALRLRDYLRLRRGEA